MFFGRNSKLSFGQQALLLISVPLVFELLFVGSLAIVLKKAEYEKNVSDQSREILLTAQSLSHSIYELVETLILYQSMRNPLVLRAYDRRATQATEMIDSLKEKLSKDRRYEERSKRIDLLARQLLDAFEILRTGIAGGDTQGNAMQFLAQKVNPDAAGGAVKDAPHAKYLYQLYVFDEVKYDTKQLVAELDKLCAEERQVSVETPVSAASARRMLETIFWCGLVGSVILAIVLTINFDRRTTSRLKVMVENTDRLAKGQELNPETGGSDEIAQLDRVFHKMAASLDEAQQLKQQFISIISHELRTPLTSLQVFLSSLAMGSYGAMSDSGQTRLSGVEFSVRRLIGLINELLDSEKIAAGQLSISCEPLSVQEVVDASADAVSEFAERKQVTIEADAIEAEVNGDRDRLIQVLVNLLSNAIKYSPEGQSVRISGSKEPGWVEISVIDKGPGVPRESQEIIFERFRQLDNDPENKTASTGLGLSICKYLVEKHGGTIGVRSTLNEGSTFWFRLPSLS